MMILGATLLHGAACGGPSADEDDDDDDGSGSGTFTGGAGGGGVELLSPCDPLEETTSCADDTHVAECSLVDGDYKWVLGQECSVDAHCESGQCTCSAQTAAPEPAENCARYCSAYDCLGCAATAEAC